MQYFALLISREQERKPDDAAAAMAAWESFHAKAGPAIKAGDALAPAAAAAVITGGPDAPVVTDGPFAETAEVACGYYIFEAENLDEALALARDVPVAAFGAVELWPVVHAVEPSRRITGNDWLALLLEPAESAHTPGTPEWEAVAAKHAELHAAAGDHIIGGAALHDKSTATTVRVRDGEVLITDGPYVESAEIATGIYLLGAADRDEAVKIASMIPASTVQLRQLAGVSGL
ncbi:MULTISPECIES: YciI family protein [Mycobacterium avium complex (MAC)]|uniref:Transcription initiation protein n=3 Tax=Mycobacterium avium TaxID=1764 RepID=A0AAI8SRI3_MYCAV|nr:MULTISPECIES: YciI family protein [Mycobacterium avium complex (MAC)]APT12771.1 transcription initiation protein [Mycobacterium avium subsp. hominissuis]ETZ47972.1 YCII-related domain protein [Mycobacterium avium MAV_120809_2495]ETZ64671.1 YCII-related domain protein [Mycobacterium sp. MAC_080597_8934]ETZ75997.1 YCII-related domain protein [Mycobacterium sp. MAC_011194_8550]KDP03693.1 transcription initiation protein [Mycobacterium avium subsp. hominissuis 100]